jgi:hypothetical protein
MASADEQRKKLTELTQQRMTFLARLYELSDADPEKDIPFDDILNGLGMDKDAGRKAELYLEGQRMIENTSPAAPPVVFTGWGENEESRTLSSGSSAILRITHKGIVKAEAEIKRKPKEPPSS